MFKLWCLKILFKYPIKKIAEFFTDEEDAEALAASIVNDNFNSKSKSKSSKKYRGNDYNDQSAFAKKINSNNLAKKLNKTSEQVLLKWALQNKVHIIPMSLNPDFIRDNISLNFEISKEDMNYMDHLNDNHCVYIKYL